MIKLSDYLVKRLEEHGVRDVFLISGGGAMHLNNAFGQSKKIKYYCNHNEQASSIAAEGYSRVANKLAVVNITTGPGGLNCLNGVFGQWTDSVPVLYISGQVKFETTIASCPELNLRQLGDQEVDIVSIVKPLTKYAVMVTDPYSIKYHLDKAITIAQSGRKGPVWLDIPINVQAAMIDEKKLKNYDPAEDLPKFPKIDASVRKTVSLIKKAKRPLIVAGNGINISQSKALFEKLIKKINIPVVTTFNAVDILEDSSQNFAGRIGTVGQRAGNFTLQNADLILFLGTRNNIRQVSYNWENFAKNAFKIVVDIDKAELNKKTLKPDIAINADVAVFLKVLYDYTHKIEKKEWLEWTQKTKKRYSFYNTGAYMQKGKNINPYYFVRKLSEKMKKNFSLIAANGSACVCMFQAGEIKKGQRVFWNSGDASMGYDLPAAIGACIAGKNRETICLAGDGSIMMNIQELQTIKHHNLSVKIFILNNDGYISIKQTQNNFFKGHTCGAGRCSGVSMPDFTKVAKAFGIKSVKLSTPAFIEKTISEVLSEKGPVLCEVITDSDYIFTPKLSSRKLDDGTMISPSLEDMYPFLDRKEFNENIIKDI